MDDWEETSIPNSKIQTLISSCSALKPEPDLLHKASLFTEGGNRLSVAEISFSLKLKKITLVTILCRSLFRELIAKYIFDMSFLKKMIDDYTLNVKDTIFTFLGVTSEVQRTTSELADYRQEFATQIRSSLSYGTIRELLEKQITCEPTDKINGGSRTFSLMNFYYKQLPMTINFLDRNSERYKIIEIVYYTPREVKPYDNDRYTKDFKNKQLLWHGTKRFNIPSILYEGFKISKAKRGLFGAGTYFTNAVTKSWRYCGSYLEGVLFLCEVALGEISTGNNGFGNGHQENPLPVGKNSVHGVGNYFPNINDFDIIDDDVLVPYGRLEFKYNGGLEFDEFIVYNTSQIKRRYLVTF
ncbi:hypothetical protein KQX54_009409 [Cotesia glomerata]|uniref:Poly [ADP-ribose] polymerase n=1 Tax=Cotesia glomerata TaxID=32391 RepID=A0AAV7HX09_COTGL|nr:hypothetical protein KQX54_009409 [Cotesia glomerata]